MLGLQSMFFVNKLIKKGLTKRSKVSKRYILSYLICEGLLHAHVMTYVLCEQTDQKAHQKFQSVIFYLFSDAKGFYMPKVCSP